MKALTSTPERSSLDYVGDYGIGGGHLAVRTDAETRMFVGHSYTPESLGLTLEAVEAECTVEPCLVRSTVRATACGHSVVLATDEDRELGKLVIVNDFYEPFASCPVTGDARDSFVIAGYAP